jgi:hypothetical protein
VGVGHEDAVVLDSGVALLSSDDKHWMKASAAVAATAAPGALHFFDFANDAAGRLKLLGFPRAATFHPHGMGVLRGAAGKHLLLVVNHNGGWNDVVEEFEVTEAPASGDGAAAAAAARVPRVTFRRGMQHAELAHLNSVAPVSETAFYATRWSHYAPESALNWVERFGRLAFGRVLFCARTGEALDCRVAAAGFQMTNGIELSRDLKVRAGACALVCVRSEPRAERVRRRLDAATGAQVRARQVSSPGVRRRRHSALAARARALTPRARSDNSLSLAATFHTYGAGDNLRLDAEGTLWLASHPQMLRFAACAFREHLCTAPSAVERVRGDAADGAETQVVLSGHGDLLAGSSVAARHGGRVLIGAVTAPGFVVCAAQ